MKNTNATNSREDLLIINKLLIIPQKGCCKRTRGTEELLYTDQHILNESKTRWKNVVMVWIDYKKSYDIVPQSWIIDSFKLYKISEKVIKFIEDTMVNWRVELTIGRKSLTEVKIQRRIFLEDALSPLLFVTVYTITYLSYGP